MVIEYKSVYTDLQWTWSWRKRRRARDWNANRSGTPRPPTVASFSPRKKCKIKKEWNGRRLQNEGQWRKGWPRTRIMRIGVGYDHITRPHSGHYYLASNCVMYVVGADQVRYKKYLGITQKRRWFRRSRPSWAASNLRAFSANRQIQGRDELFDVKLQLRLATDDIDGSVAF